MGWSSGRIWGRNNRVKEKAIHKGLIMPFKPLRPSRPCPGRGPRRGTCPNLIRGSAKCCPECEPWEKRSIREYDQERGNSGERGYDAAWQRVREWKANRDPLCEICVKQGRIRPLDKVHHIKPIETHPELRLDIDNLMSVCTKHHEEIHKGERWAR